MSNRITIELCAEDRARLDRLAEALERKACDKCVTAAIQLAKTEQESVAAEEAAEAPEDITPVSKPPGEEKPADEESEPQGPVRTVARGELRNLVIDLSAKGLKDQVRDIVRTFADNVKEIPEDKLAACYEKLATLK